MWPPNITQQHNNTIVDTSKDSNPSQYFLQSISVDQCSLYLLCCIYVSPLGLLGQLGSLHQLVLLCHVACKIVLSSLNMSLFKGGGGGGVFRCRNTVTGSCSTVSGQVPSGGRRPGHRVTVSSSVSGSWARVTCVCGAARVKLGCWCHSALLSPQQQAWCQLSCSFCRAQPTARPAPRTPLRGSKLIAATAAVARPDRRVTAAHGDNRGSLLQYLHLHVGQYAVAELREQCDPNLTWKQNDV